LGARGVLWSRWTKPAPGGQDSNTHVPQLTGILGLRVPIMLSALVTASLVITTRSCPGHRFGGASGR
jgi:hypothetical protein